MKLIRVAEHNKPYYSEDYIKGFNDGAKRQYEADKKEVRHGRWKCVSIGRYGCSLCGHEPYYVKNLHYCPNCGASMDEVRE